MNDIVTVANFITLGECNKVQGQEGPVTQEWKSLVSGESSRGPGHTGVNKVKAAVTLLSLLCLACELVTRFLCAPTFQLKEAGYILSVKGV